MPLSLDAWPGTTGFATASYFDHFLEQMQFGMPSIPGVLPSRDEDILGSYTDECKVVGDSSGMQVKVSQGRIWCKGLLAKIPDASVTGGVYALALTAAHATLQRIDRVIVRFDLTTGESALQMLDGTAATTGTAVPAALSASATEWDVPLALVIVDAAVTTIAPLDVIDNRQFTYTNDSLMRALAIENPIIDGGMSLWPDGTSFSSIADETYGPVLFKYNKSGAVVHDLTRASDVPAVDEAVGLENYSLKLDVTTADSSIASGDFSIVQHTIEGRRIKPLLQRGFTVSFWVKAPVLGVYCVAFRNSGTDRSFVAQIFVTAADTWELHTVHVPPSPTAGTWDYDTGVGLRMSWAQACGSTYQTSTPGSWVTGNFLGTSRQINANGNTSYNWQLAMVGRMSLGGLALPFAPHNDEEALSKRYYEVLGGNINTESFGAGEAYASTDAAYVVTYASKRATPTLTFSTASNFMASDAAAGVVAGTVIGSSVPAKNSSGVLLTVASGLTQGRATRLLAVNTSATIKVSARY